MCLMGLSDFLPGQVNTIALETLGMENITKLDLSFIQAKILTFLYPWSQEICGRTWDRICVCSL